MAAFDSLNGELGCLTLFSFISSWDKKLCHLLKGMVSTDADHEHIIYIGGVGSGRWETMLQWFQPGCDSQGAPHKCSLRYICKKVIIYPY